MEAMNVSDGVFTSALPSVETTPTMEYNVWQSALIGIFLSLIILLSIGGNMLVCIAILTDRNLKKVSNLFLMSLAIADLVVSCLVMPFAVANDILGFWPFAPQFCNIWISFDILSATASILNLCAISLDRYIHMKSPFHYEQWMTNKKCLIFIGLIWIASILISFLPINLGWHQHGVTNETLDFENDTMDINSTITSAPQCFMELNPSYALISSSISFYIPCIVMVTIYIQIYKLARHHANSIKKTQSFSQVTSANSAKSRFSENKALFTLGMIMGLFLLSWIPFFIVNIVNAFCSTCVPGKVFAAVIWLGYCNSTMNPLIYSKFNTDFREAFKKILCCQRCRNRDPYKINKGSISRAASLSMSKKLSNGCMSNGYNEQTNGLLNNNKLDNRNDVELSMIDNQSKPEEQSVMEEQSLHDVTMPLTHQPE